MLKATLLIFVGFFVFLLLDLINLSVVLSFSDQELISAYNETIIFKMLIRRLTELLVFKVLYTLKRVQIQMDHENTTR